MSGEPTLQKGDKSADGWVEFLQELLVNRGADVKIDGDFGDETFKAVVAFQKDYELQDRSGVVGNET
jgi:peptidoglycan hydrolase-like protein with peptidoglycan-binding domain